MNLGLKLNFKLDSQVKHTVVQGPDRTSDLFSKKYFSDGPRTFQTGPRTGPDRTSLKLSIFSTIFL